VLKLLPLCVEHIREDLLKQKHKLYIKKKMLITFFHILIPYKLAKTKIQIFLKKWKHESIFRSTFRKNGIIKTKIDMKVGTPSTTMVLNLQITLLRMNMHLKKDDFLLDFIID